MHDHFMYTVNVCEDKATETWHCHMGADICSRLRETNRTCGSEGITEKKLIDTGIIGVTHPLRPPVWAPMIADISGMAAHEGCTSTYKMYVCLWTCLSFSIKFYTSNTITTTITWRSCLHTTSLKHISYITVQLPTCSLSLIIEFLHSIVFRYGSPWIGCRRFPTDRQSKKRFLKNLRTAEGLYLALYVWMCKEYLMFKRRLQKNSLIRLHTRAYAHTPKYSHAVAVWIVSSYYNQVS